MDRNQRSTRRKVLASAGTVATLVVAGCGGPGEPEDGGDTPGDEEPGGNDGLDAEEGTGNGQDVEDESDAGSDSEVDETTEDDEGG